MRVITLSSACMALALAACSSENGPTQPEVDEPLATTSSLVAAKNTWTPRAPRPGVLFETFAGVARNSAGQSIVYVFGGTDGEGGTGFGTSAYNVATNTWTGGLSNVGVFGANGVGKIGSKLYFSGGYNEVETPSSFTNAVWAYDYSRDRLIRKADLPIFGAEGVTGVIKGKLYVLPGACSGDRYPNPGYCAEEPTRRFFRYDPGINTWVTRREAPHVHRQGAAAVIGGKFYVAGGFNGFQPVTALDVYDPATNTWRTLAPLPTGGTARGDAVKGQFFVVVQSFDGTTSVTRAYAYNPKTNTWKMRAAPQWHHDAVVRVILDGLAHLLAVGGSRGPDFDTPNDSELYTP
ncbi:MAG: hypothetical protein H0X69_15990 [Gemmatimonadales bacterium]|nr:hypothetical protein [Gemmatimonadales bacterium]